MSRYIKQSSKILCFLFQINLIRSLYNLYILTIMKQKFKALLVSAKSVIRHAPIEFILSLMMYVCFLFRELMTDFSERLLIIYPLIMLFVLTVNFWTKNKMRMLYFLSPLIGVPLYFIHFTPSVPYIMALLCFFILINASSLNKDNNAFCRRSGNFSVSLFYGFILSSILLGIISSIIATIIYIFHLDVTNTAKIYEKCLSFAYIVALPFLTITLNSYFEEEVKAQSKTISIFLNFILTPAIFIYTLILYVYAIKIIFQQEYPLIGVEYMIFAYVIAVCIAHILHIYNRETKFTWFYRFISFATLPLVVLFWFAAMNRILQYGMTANRLYLLICGISMTSYPILFISKRTNRFIYISVLTFLLIGTFTFIPALQPSRLYPSENSELKKSVVSSRFIRFIPESYFTFGPQDKVFLLSENWDSKINEQKFSFRDGKITLHLKQENDSSTYKKTISVSSTLLKRLKGSDGVLLKNNDRDSNKNVAYPINNNYFKIQIGQDSTLILNSIIINETDSEFKITDIGCSLLIVK